MDGLIFGFGFVVTVIVGTGLTLGIIANNRDAVARAADSAQAGRQQPTDR